MNQNLKIVCVIPARLASTRFPRKMLANILGRPLLSWVWDAATSVKLFSEVVFAIDSEQTAAVIKSFGGRYLMTSPDCKSGTDRLAELLIKGKLDGDILVNWQGDEPFITPPMITTLLSSCHNENEEIWTLKSLIKKPEDIFSPNVAKIVCDVNGFALYLSRSPIPFSRDESDPAVLAERKIYYKHIGLYAFRPQALRTIAAMGPSVLEDTEKLEHLRFLEYGLRMRAHQTDQEVFGVDTPADLIRAEQFARTLTPHQWK